MNSFRQATLLLLVSAAGANATFAPPSTVKLAFTLLASIPNAKLKVVEGEEFRIRRRTEYVHEDWVRHRSENRFFRDLGSTFTFDIYRKIGKEVLATVAVATWLCVYNALVGVYTDFEGVKHAGPLANGFLPVLSLPIAPFELSIPSLALLLVFRTNASYKRWDQTVKNWGMSIALTRNIVRMCSAYYDREGIPEHIVKVDLHRLALCTWAFVRANKRHLSPAWDDEEAFQRELFDRLPLTQAEKIIAASHRPNRAMQDLSYVIETLPMNFIRKNEIHKAASAFQDTSGSSILRSPVPLSYSRHTARFTALWLLMLPFGLFNDFGLSWNHIGIIPATAIIASSLFGIDEIATQLEEPFTILPMQAFCDKVYNGCMEIVSWGPNDNDLFTEEYIAQIETLKSKIQHGVSAEEKLHPVD